MKNLFTMALTGALLAMAPQASLAMDSMHGSMMAMPTCAAGDPVVGVNTMTKMYMSVPQMKMKSAGMTADQKSAMMMKNHIKMMCKSKADAMGGKMMMSKPM